MKSLTNTQAQLYNEVCIHMKIAYEQGRQPLTYEELKIKSNFKSFDSTINALLMKGYIFRFPTNDYSNRFLCSSPLK